MLKKHAFRVLEVTQTCLLDDKTTYKRYETFEEYVNRIYIKCCKKDYRSHRFTCPCCEKMIYLYDKPTFHLVICPMVYNFWRFQVN
jgi:hypothetical protein